MGLSDVRIFFQAVANLTGRKVDRAIWWILAALGVATLTQNYWGRATRFELDKQLVVVALTGYITVRFVLPPVGRFIRSVWQAISQEMKRIKTTSAPARGRVNAQANP